jgi:hypothetical protein
MKRQLVALAALLGLAALPSAASADDWLAAKLRGGVVVEQDGRWVPLHRGDIVSDARSIKTLAGGVVEFTRDGEVINVAPNSQIQIHDRIGQRYTTVTETTGTIAIEANVENVRHFEVDTPLLVAVVKGTKFTVTTNGKRSRVRVTRGKVGVEDLHSHTHVDVLVNQTATVGIDQPLTVGGSGTLQTISNAATTAAASASDKTANTGTDNGKGNGGANNGQGNAYGVGNHASNGGGSGKN